MAGTGGAATGVVATGLAAAAGRDVAFFWVTIGAG